MTQKRLLGISLTQGFCIEFNIQQALVLHNQSTHLNMNFKEMLAD